jgi:hypothetical protein
MIPQRVTRDMYERRFQQRVSDQVTYNNYQRKIRAEQMDRTHQETDARAVQRQKLARQRVADQEFDYAERIYKRQHSQELHERETQEQDAIANALHNQIQAETRDEKYRGVIRENDPEYRELRAKLQMALISQTRDSQRREQQMRRQLEEQERLEQETEVLRNYRRDEAARAAEEDEKHQESLFAGRILQDQMRDQERRRQLMEAAQSEKDRGQVDAVVRRVTDEDAEHIRTVEAQKDKERAEMYDFMAARARMREEERLLAEEEDRKMKAFNTAIDERLERALADQKRREATRAKIAQKIALDIKRKRDEADDYENLCLELAKQQELQRLNDRAAAEERKLQQQHEEMRRFMIETMRAKAERIARDDAAKAAFERQVMEQTKRLEELAVIEEEKNQLRIEKYRRELARQMVQKKVMYEEARQEELRKLQVEQEREAEKQRILEEERRKLVINHILAMGPEAVKYLPKGVLREDDLNYLPEDYRNAVLRLQSDTATRTQ